MRGTQVARECSVRGLELETQFHVFFDCQFSKRIGEMVGGWVTDGVSEWAFMMDFWERIFIKAKQLSIELFFQYTGYCGITGTSVFMNPSGQNQAY